MRRLWPEPGDVEDVAALVADEARPPPADRPWVLVNMVASLDGAITIDGRSGALGGPGDKALFSALRQVADVVLVGAGTARTEDYGPTRASQATREARADRGQARLPRLAVVSRSLALDPAARMFSDPSNRPIVITHEGADADRALALSEVAEVRQIGVGDVDLPAALAQLHAEGNRIVTCEGGPSLNGHLVAQDLIDEWALTISPQLVAGDIARSTLGGTADPRAFALDRLLESDGELLGRWVRRRPSPT